MPDEAYPTNEIHRDRCGRSTLRYQLHDPVRTRIRRLAQSLARLVRAALRPEPVRTVPEVGSSTSFAAAWATRSRTVGMPNGRGLPSPFGIRTRRTHCAW